MAELTLLQIAQEFCKRKKLPSPQTVVGAQDDLTLQIWGLMNEGIQDIVARYNHQQLQTPIQFFHIGGPGFQALDLGNMVNTLGFTLTDFKFMIPQTLWSVTTRLPVTGPLSSVQWMTLTTMLMAQSLYSFMQANNSLYIFGQPNPLTSVTFGMFYQSKCGVVDSLVNVETYITDASQPRIPSALILADLKWRYAMNNGLPYAEDQRISEEALTNSIGGNDQGVLIMDGNNEFNNFPPGVIVPAGTWNVH